MGILEILPDGKFCIVDVELVKQTVSPASIDIDTDWWADQQVRLFEQRGIQPWQTSCWIHTHPGNMNHPSRVDDETMETSFGAWDFAIMAILTQAGNWYCRLDFTHGFAGTPCRMQVEQEMEILWDEKFSIDTQQWEASYRDLVTADFHAKHTSISNGLGIDVDFIDDSPWRDEQKDEEEVEQYVEDCECGGLDPLDPDSYRHLYGESGAPDRGHEFSERTRAAFLI